MNENPSSPAPEIAPAPATKEKTRLPGIDFVPNRVILVTVKDEDGEKIFKVIGSPVPNLPVSLEEVVPEGEDRPPENLELSFNEFLSLGQTTVVNEEVPLISPSDLK